MKQKKMSITKKNEYTEANWTSRRISTGVMTPVSGSECIKNITEIGTYDIIELP